MSEAIDCTEPEHWFDNVVGWPGGHDGGIDARGRALPCRPFEALTPEDVELQRRIAEINEAAYQPMPGLEAYQNDQGAEIEPGGPMTPDVLREIADWLGTYDAFATEVLPLLLDRRPDLVAEVKAVQATAEGSEIQDDLRRWADELEERYLYAQPEPEYLPPPAEDGSALRDLGAWSAEARDVWAAEARAEAQVGDSVREYIDRKLLEEFDRKLNGAWGQSEDYVPPRELEDG